MKIGKRRYIEKETRSRKMENFVLLVRAAAIVAWMITYNEYKGHLELRVCEYVILVALILI